MAELTPLDMPKLIPLVTGGGSGIGFGFVKQLLERGCPKVIITGRREQVLMEAAGQYPEKVFYKVSDAGKAQDREELLQWVKENHPDCNALINNAGIQRLLAPALDNGPWEERAPEIEINIAGPIHLCTLFIPYFLSKEKTCVVANVSSGLAFVPFPAGPVYGASKAAIHSYSMAMRYSLEDTNVRMVEIAPPAVKSNLGGLHDFGEEIDEYCASAIERLAAGEMEFGYKISDAARMADRKTVEQMMENLAANLHVQRFSKN